MPNLSDIVKSDANLFSGVLRSKKFALATTAITVGFYFASTWESKNVIAAAIVWVGSLLPSVVYIFAQGGVEAAAAGSISNPADKPK